MVVWPYGVTQHVSTSTRSYYSIHVILAMGCGGLRFLILVLSCRRVFVFSTCGVACRVGFFLALSCDACCLTSYRWTHFSYLVPLYWRCILYPREGTLKSGPNIVCNNRDIVY